MNNVMKLTTRVVSNLAIPDGGGLMDGLEFLSNASVRKEKLAEAKTQVSEMLQAVRKASEPNPWKNASDEEIAGMILDQAEARKRNA